MKTLKELFLFTVVAILISATEIGCQNIEDNKDIQISSKIDNYVSELIKESEPGCVIIVIKDTTQIFRHAYGVANVELNVKMEPEMVFKIGSLTKQFTAISVMMLIEKGKLSLNDDISKFLPEFNNQTNSILVKHLLSHTSGIIDYLELDEFKTQMRDDLTNDDIIKMVLQSPLTFSPGEKVAYSNSNYALLGAIIENVSSQSYEDFIVNNIVKPLELNNTQIVDNFKIIPKMVSGYGKSNGNFQKPKIMSYSYLHAAGGLCSNADDLVKWNDAISNGNIINMNLLNKCITPKQLENGNTIPVGYGWFLKRLYDKRILYLGGAIYGYTNHTIYIPDEKLYVTVLRNSNNWTTETRIITERIVGIILGKFSPKSISVIDKSELEKYVGTYKFNDSSTRKVMTDGHKLYYGTDKIRRMVLTQRSKTKFTLAEGKVKLEFFFNDKNQVDSLNVSNDSDSKIGIKQ